MKKINVTKVVSVLVFIPLITLTGFYANANNEVKTKTTNENISLDFGDISFSDFKNISIDALNEELKFSINDKAKAQIEKSIKNLKKINEEKKFIEVLEKEYSKIDSIYLEIINISDLSDKNQILSDLESELENLVKDDSIKNKIILNISELRKLDNEDSFFDKLDETYDFLDKYYEKNDIKFFDDILPLDEDGILNYSFDNFKKEILKSLKKDLSKADFDKFSKITDEDKFYDELYKINKFDN